MIKRLCLASLIAAVCLVGWVVVSAPVQGQAIGGVRCPDGQLRDPNTGRCPACPPGFTDKLKDYVGKCMPVGTLPQSQTCPDGQRRDERGRCPACPPGQTDTLKDFKGKCMPIGTLPQSQTCPDGQRRDERGRCPNCKAGYTDKLKGFEGKCMPIGTRIN